MIHTKVTDGEDKQLEDASNSRCLLNLGRNAAEDGKLSKNVLPISDQLMEFELTHMKLRKALGSFCFAV